MMTLMDIIDERNDFEKYGMRIKLQLPRSAIYDFRIVFGNPNTKNTRDGITICTGSLQVYTSEIVQQLTTSGFFVQELSDDPWTKDCFYAYRRSKDVNLKYPQLKVYIHPNEMAGWASKKEIDKFLDIAKENSILSNVRLVYKQKVYNMDDECYLNILKESEEQILAWLVEYKKHHGRRMSAAGKKFNEIFGIKRLQCKHLSYDDYVAINYVEQLVHKLTRCTNAISD